MTKYENKWIYAVYKGDKYLTEGTREEICDTMKIKKNTFYYYRSPYWHKRFKKGNNHITIIRIDNISEE